MKVPVPVVAVLMIAAAIPLALRKVPRNSFYGFRVPKTMRSPEIWYAANQKAGINLLIGSGLTLIVWGVLCFAVGVDRANLTSLPIFVVATLAGLAVSFVQLKRL